MNEDMNKAVVELAGLWAKKLEVAREQIMVAAEAVSDFMDKWVETLEDLAEGEPDGPVDGKTKVSSQSYIDRLKTMSIDDTPRERIDPLNSQTRRNKRK